MEVIGWMVAMMAMAFAIDAQSKVKKLEKRLQEKGVFEDGTERSDESD